LLRVLHRFNGLPVCSQTHPGCDLTQMAVWISEEIFSAYSLLLFLRDGSQESKYPRMRLVPLNLWIEGGRIGTEVEQTSEKKCRLGKIFERQESGERLYL
jgi:hypothetical protein